jgi:hypothetical protein
MYVKNLVLINSWIKSWLKISYKSIKSTTLTSLSRKIAQPMTSLISSKETENTLSACMFTTRSIVFRLKMSMKLLEGFFMEY